MIEEYDNNFLWFFLKLTLTNIFIQTAISMFSSAINNNDISNGCCKRIFLIAFVQRQMFLLKRRIKMS